jgi:hypothetical protein
MSSLHPDTRVTPNERVMLTELGDGTGVLLHLDTKFYYTLNPTGFFVWKFMNQRSKSLGELVGALTREFEIDPSTAALDLEALLSDLSGEKLVVVLPAG